MRLSPIAAAARASATLAMNARARALRAKGGDVVLFTVGEPDFDTPENIRQAAHRAIQAGFTRYTAAAGMPELRAAIADKFRTDNGLDYAPEQVLVSSGGKHALYQIMLSLVGPGDEVLLAAPYWVSYADQAEICGATPVAIDTTDTDDLKLTPERLREAITPRSRLLVLNYPNNPTGVMPTAGEIRALVDVALEHDLWIISDEIYEHLIYDGRTPVSPAGFSPEAMARVVTVNGVSKTYAMTGWRIGYAAGSAEVIRAAAMLQSNITSGPCSIAQKAALEALTGPQESVEEMRQAFDERRRAVVRALAEVPGVKCPTPQGAFYVLPDCRGLMDATYGGRRVENSMDLAEALLEQVGVAVIPGAPFGAAGYLRFSYATSMADIEAGMERFAAFVATREE